MRKRKIIEQNALLFNQIETLNKKIKELEEKLQSSEQEIEELKAETKEKPTDNSAENKTPIEELKEKVLDLAPFNAEEYGAKAIGKIVVATATVTAVGSENGNNIETVNRILGMAEVAKSNILSAVSDNTDEKEKRLTIDKIVEKTCDYIKTANNSLS